MALLMTSRIRTLPLTIVALLLLTACGTATSTVESPSAVPTPSDVADPTTSPAPSPSSTPEASPSEAAGGAIPVDAIAVATVDGLRIRATPGVDGEELGTLTSGFESLVVDGPEMVDGMEWYLLSGLGLPNGSGCATGPDPTHPYQCPVWLGWAARAATDGTTWLEETEPECADPEGSLDAFVSQPRLLYIACYGNEPLTFRAYHVFTPGVADCPGVPEAVYWLGCAALHQLASAPTGVVGLGMTVAPDGSLTDDPGELLITGHFDDPASSQCAQGDQPEAAVLSCRSQFVVESGTVVGQ
jgi:hypothetical protein